MSDNQQPDQNKTNAQPPNSAGRPQLTLPPGSQQPATFYTPQQAPNNLIPQQQPPLSLQQPNPNLPTQQQPFRPQSQPPGPQRLSIQGGPRPPPPFPQGPRPPPGQLQQGSRPPPPQFPPGLRLAPPQLQLGPRPMPPPFPPGSRPPVPQLQLGPRPPPLPFPPGSRPPPPQLQSGPRPLLPPFPPGFRPPPPQFQQGPRLPGLKFQQDPRPQLQQGPRPQFQQGPGPQQQGPRPQLQGTGMQQPGLRTEFPQGPGVSIQGGPESSVQQGSRPKYQPSEYGSEYENEGQKPILSLEEEQNSQSEDQKAGPQKPPGVRRRVRKSKPKEDYDPYQHRDPAKCISNWQGTALFIKAGLGSGILMMPFGYSKLGLLGGLLVNVFVFILVTHCTLLLFKSSYTQCKRKRVPSLTYSNTVKVAFRYGPPRFRKFSGCLSHVVAFGLIVHHVGTSSLYIFNVSRNLKWIVDPLSDISMELHMTIVAIPIMLFALITSFKIIAPMAILSYTLILGALSVLIVYSFLLPKPDNSRIILFTSVSDFPIYVNIMLFAVTAIGVVQTIETHVKEPMRFRGVTGYFCISMGLTTLINVIFGLIGYNFCRKECSEKIEEILPSHSKADLAITWLYMIALPINFVLHNFVSATIILDFWKRRKSIPPHKMRKVTVLIRLILYLATWLIAFSMQTHALSYILLLDAIVMPIITLMVPSALDSLEATTAFSVLKNGAIALFGVAVLISAFSTELSNTLSGMAL